MVAKILLDGSKMRAKTFYRKFREIVGVHFGWWIRRKNVRYWGGEDIYDYQDDNFVYGGSAYDPPKLFQK